MPDPRQPHRPAQPPMPRQPAPPPARRTQPVERPVPHDPAKDHLGAKDIVVGDPNAARGGVPRPVRPLDPSMQPPPIEHERKIRKGESFWVMGHEECPAPRKAKVIRLTAEPGKGVGVEFEEPIGGIDKDGNPWGVIHTCDGHGKSGHCLYVRPDQVLDDKALETFKARKSEAERTESAFEEFDEITVGPQHSMVQTPAMPRPDGMKELPGPGDKSADKGKNEPRVGGKYVEEDDEDDDK